MSNYKIELKWAVIFIITLLLWSFIERIAGFHDSLIEYHAMFSMVFMIPAIVVFVLALKQKKSTFYSGQMSFKQGFVSGLIISLIVALVNPGTQWLISNVIAPDYFNNIITYSVENGYYVSLDAAKEYFNYKNYAIQGTISAFVMGAVTSLVIALIIKSKKQ